MEAMDFVQHPYLGQFLKTFAAGEELFRQGEAAHTMFLIVSGRVHLEGEQGNGTYVAAILDQGQILGEKVLFSASPYQRSFTARAVMETTALEVSAADLKTIEETNPQVMTALLRGILKVVAVRFDRVNYLVKLMRSSNPVERMTQLILYFSRSSGRVTSEGQEVVLSVDALHHYMDLEPEAIERGLRDLVKRGLLVKTEQDKYLIPDELALLQHGRNTAVKRAA